MRSDRRKRKSREYDRGSIFMKDRMKKKEEGTREEGPRMKDGKS